MLKKNNLTQGIVLLYITLILSLITIMGSYFYVNNLSEGLSSIEYISLVVAQTSFLWTLLFILSIILLFSLTLIIFGIIAIFKDEKYEIDSIDGDYVAGKIDYKNYKLLKGK